MWTAIDPEFLKSPLGTLPKKPQTISVAIPAEVPDMASEILVYVWYSSGNVPHDLYSDYKIFVQIQHEKEAAFYLHLKTYPQKAYATNSDNVWLPMPPDRRLWLKYKGTDFSGGDYFYSEVRIVAYR